MDSKAPEHPPSSGPSLLDLPNEVVLDYLLPSLDAKDIAAVSRTNTELHALAEDETLWLRLTLLHYSYHPSLLAPPTPHSGWSKRVYLGLRSPEATVWGSTDNGRLGVDEGTVERGIRRHRRHVDHPVTVTFSTSSLPIPRSGLVPPSTSEHLRETKTDEGQPQIIDLQAGGYGFTARDADGGVWAWGQLDGSVIGFSQPLSNSHALCARPTKLALPCRAETICTGRKHVLVLDSDNLIWEMRSWGLAYHHTAPALTAPTNSGSSSSSKHIRQISAGWSHSACLTANGEIYVWYPFTDAYGQALTPDSELSSSTASGDDRASQKWGKVGDVVVSQTSIPARPTRPLSDFDNPTKGQEVHNARLKKLEEAWISWEDKASPKEKSDGELVIKIASGADFIVALKSNGEVWMHKLQTRGESWILLPHLSGPGTTHLTAQYLSITSYSPTTIHHVRIPDHMQFDPSQLVPIPVPVLEGKRIIQIASGDYHEVALTEGGEVWTWGQGDHGQLGTGKTVRLAEEPERVIFAGEEEGGKRRFAFGVTAAGWHTGALLLGDDPLHPVAASITSSNTEDGGVGAGGGGAPPDPWADTGPPGPNPDRPGPHATQAQTPGPGTGQSVLAHPIFRVGYAGRGSGIGNVARRNWQRRQQAEEGRTGEQSGEGSRDEGHTAENGGTAEDSQKAPEERTN